MIYAKRAFADDGDGSQKQQQLRHGTVVCLLNHAATIAQGIPLTRQDSQPLSRVSCGNDFTRGWLASAFAADGTSKVKV